MALDLRDVPSVIVNLPEDKHRRDYMTGLFSRLGMPHDFVPGVTRFGKKKNVAAAHANAFDTVKACPFLIFEDDQELLWDDCILPDPPEGADVIYLANSQLGCLPDTVENKARFGLNAYQGLALAEVFDDHYLRLSSMISAMAILIMSEKGRTRYRSELKKAFNRDTGIDVRYAFAMPDLNVYALRNPMFAEAPELQIKSKQSQARYDETHLPLPVAKEGEIRIARHRHRTLVVRATRVPETGALKWEVEQATRPDEMLSPMKLPATRLPGYNQNILNDRIEVIEKAKVFPLHPETNSCGVTDEIGRFCAHSAEYRWVKRRMPAPEFERHDEEFQQLSGTYLYGGWLHPHFGHFLAESTARLWGLNAYDGEIDGILYIPYGPKTIWRTRKTYAPILRLLADETPVIPQNRPAIVERLIVPEPGFGHRARMQGSPEYIRFVREKVAEKIVPDGPERLYISRTGLGYKRGGVIGEEYLEDFLSKQGYEIFHPQRYPAEVQLARYAAAKLIVSLDGSPLHFAAFAAQGSAKVAIIKRRISDLPDDMARHVHRFCGAEVTVIDAIKEMWVHEQSRRIDYSSFGRLDFKQVKRELAMAGFCEPDGEISAISDDQIEEILNARPDEAPTLVPFSRK
ncbi:glycosyltransferase 61 family protein [Yoonia sp.]|uniref:glycosyltransferase 61 family protein n=1 Tax=Yoonia sp. TaxID=2212373 RepID=UPI002FD93B67